jgi:putative MATE family efflux protein
MSLPIIFFVTSLGIGLAVAGSALTAQYFGAKNQERLSHATGQTMLMVVIVSLFFSLVGHFSATFLLRLLGTDPGILSDASSYLKIAFLGMTFNFCFFIFQSIMRSIGRPKVPVYIIIGTVLLNFILDPILMFGFGPIPAFGIVGVAWATIITQSLASIIGLMILFGGKYGIKLHYYNFLPDMQFIKKAFWLGLPSSIEQSARSLSLSVTTAFIAVFGTLAVAAYGVGSNILQVMLMLAFGLNGATAALVGQSLGANRPKEAKSFAILSLKTTIIGFSILGAFVFIFAPYLIKFFIPDDPNVIEAGARYLRFITPTFLLIGIQISIAGTLQAAGNTKSPMKLTLISQWLIQLPLIYFLPKLFNLGLDGIWISFPLTAIIAALAYLHVFKYSGWENRKLLSKEEQLQEKINEEAEIETAVPL